MAMALALIAATLWLYPAQTKGMARRWQFILPALRVAAICALTAALLKPTLIRPRTEAEHGAVVLLVDRSASMSIADGQMPPARRVAIADAIGSLPEGARSDVAPDAQRNAAALGRSLDRLARSESDLDYAKLTGRQIERQAQDYEGAFEEVLASAHALATSLAPVAQQDPLKSQAQLLSGTPAAGERVAWRKKLSDLLLPLEQQLEQRQAESDAATYAANAQVREVSDATAKQSRFALGEEALTNPKVGLLSQIGMDVPLYGYAFSDRLEPLPLRSATQNVTRLLTNASGPQSRVAGAIVSAMEDLKGRPVRAIVVLSDGRAVGESAASRLAAGNTPVYSIACGEERAFTDLSIVAVDMPSSAYAGEDVNALVKLKSTNIPAGEYQVTMAFADQQASNKVKLDANGTAETQFTFRPQKAGVERLRISAGTVAGEATEKNNQFERDLKVIQDKLSILLVTSHPSWDFQYVRNALTRTKWARLSDVIIHDAQLSTTPETILQQNVIALFRVSSSMLSAQQIDAIHRAVTERGASLILIPGLDANLEDYSRNALLAELLPFRPGVTPVWRSWPGDRPAFRIVPDGPASTLDALRLSDDPAESASRWMNLPAVYHYLAIPQLKPNVIRTLLIEKESRVPVLVESRLGIGRVLFLGLEESWRWRLRVGERDQDRFWLQLVRYSAEEPYTLVSDALAIDADKVVARPGEEVRLRSRVSTTAPSRTRPTVEIRQDGRLVRIEEATPRDVLQPGRYETLIRDLPEGAYQVVVKLPGTTSSLELPLQVRQGLEEELADVSADPKALAQISASTGGGAVRIDEVGEISRQLSQVRHRQGSMLEIPLWTSGYLFLFVLGCLAVEWAMRKRLGLA